MITVHALYNSVQLVKHVEKNINYLYCKMGGKSYKYAEINNRDLIIFLDSNNRDNSTNKLNKILKRKSLCQ